MQHLFCGAVHTPAEQGYIYFWVLYCRWYNSFLYSGALKGQHCHNGLQLVNGRSMCDKGHQNLTICKSSVLIYYNQEPNHCDSMENNWFGSEICMQRTPQSNLSLSRIVPVVYSFFSRWEPLIHVLSELLISFLKSAVNADISALLQQTTLC